MSRQQTKGDKRYVYFGQCASGGPIKIGASSNPVHRARRLRWDGWQDFQILATIPNPNGLTGGAEREMWDRFDHLRQQGEWYHPAPELVDYVDDLGYCHPDPPKRKGGRPAIHNLPIHRYGRNDEKEM